MERSQYYFSSGLMIQPFDIILKNIQMYNSVFGFGSNEFDSEMDTWTPSIDQYEEGLAEMPMDKPYEFCDNIKHSGGEESKIMDFKTGKHLTIQAQPPLPLFSSTEY